MSPRALWAAATKTRGRRAASAAAAAAVIVVVVGGAVVALRDDGDSHAVPPPTSTTRPAGTSTTEADLPQLPDDGLVFIPEDVSPGGSTAPLTGLPVTDPDRLGRAALAVKVDNLDVPGETARPQVGLAHADVVVEEVVEGGITRFVAVLHSTDAPTVGPVRSARTTDVHLLPAFGTPLFAYSGGNPAVVGAVRSSARIIDRGGEWPPAYARVPERRAPHDLFVDPAHIWAPGGGTPPPTFAAFRPEADPSPGGEAVKGLRLDLPGRDAAPVTWMWSPEHRRWLRYQRDTLHVDDDGYTIGPRNVIVMATDYVASSADPRSPEGISVGSGDAWVFTDGKVITGRWERPTEDDPIAFVGPDGSPISLAAGRTWVELVKPGTTSLIH